MFSSSVDRGVRARLASLEVALVASTSDAATVSRTSRLRQTPFGSPVVPEV